MSVFALSICEISPIKIAEDARCKRWRGYDKMRGRDDAGKGDDAGDYKGHDNEGYMNDEQDL